ncbi:MAG: hypothetical protein DDT34_02558 [Firmicutes bacterium]|nr:hypothetical protein [Bacillota bacterium]
MAICLPVLALDDGEGVEDIGDVSFIVDAVKVEVQRVQASATVGAVVFIPGKRLADIAQVVSEGCQVVGRIGQT